jgi:predicted PurR-regulated permease PerM
MRLGSGTASKYGHMSKSSTPSHILQPIVTANFAKKASFALTFLLCTGTLVYGLLPGLLAVCLGYLLAAALVGAGRTRGLRLKPTVAAGLVIMLPVIAIVLFVANAQGMVFGAVAQYQALLHHLAGTVLEIRQKLPPNLASHLPDEIIAAQTWLASYLQSQARALTGAGTAGLHGGLLVYVGLVVGALIVGTPTSSSMAPLRRGARERAVHFIEAFRQIVVAQFWIAGFNATCTALFLLVALPLFGVSMPYVGPLVALTFIAGLIPIVGNLLCNGVLTLAGVSVSPVVGLASLVFLVVIHKAEYVINAKVVGKRTGTSTWELLAVMFIGEAVFGIGGLVAAPLYYAYVKKELQVAGLV